jgi:signal transduction histidine kinase
MNRPRSLRLRLLLGALLWSTGVVVAVFGGSLLIFRRHLENRYQTLVAERSDEMSKVVAAQIDADLGSMPRAWPAVFFTVAAATMAGGFVLVRAGIEPLEGLRLRIAGVRAGRDRRVAGDYPTEVGPLVEELNALLAHDETVVARSQALAANLAHSLKTPLAILVNEGARLAENGEAGAAAVVEREAGRMARQVDVQLARARAAASGQSLGGIAPVAPSVERLTRAMRRLHEPQHLVIVADVVDDARFRGEPVDLEEMLGNLLDNACKWARTRVEIAVSRPHDELIVTIDDDGPGLPPTLRDTVFERGKRLDEEKPGSGIGLAIVRELADLYGGRVTLGESPTGGARAILYLPAASG